MKKVLVLYTSNTGSTETYANDIAHGVDGDVMPLKKFRWKNIDDYQIVVYGGWVNNGAIQGINDFLYDYENRLANKDVLIFSCGMSFPTENGRKELIDRNYLSPYHVRFYQVRGSFDFKKLNFFQKMIMKSSIKMIANSADATPEQKMLTTVLDAPLEYYDREKVERILTVIRKLQDEPIETEVSEK